MELTALTALSPLDGRYQAPLQNLRPLVSEYGLILRRVIVEIEWIRALIKIPELGLHTLEKSDEEFLKKIIDEFSLADAERIKNIELKTNHDVKAVEYFLQEKFSACPALKKLIPFIHFACTSEDINNVAYALMVAKTRQQILVPTFEKLIQQLHRLAQEQAELSMLSRTHGQAATPTTLGKELMNVVVRLEKPFTGLKTFKLSAKFNGAVGNFNAHRIAYPQVNWPQVSRQFIESLGFEWNAFTTQIEPHDNLVEFLQILQRANTILIDLDRDLWGYISLGYFLQKPKEGEVGSSTMPHKVNPIDFENSEGNLGVANALIQHFAEKLPLSRWQRDLTDSTVLRNLGSIFAYIYLAMQNTMKGLNKLQPNPEKLQEDLNQHWEILAEAIQTVMRAQGITDAYEQLKDFTRGKKLNAELMKSFINQSPLPDNLKKVLNSLKPEHYTGYAAELVLKRKSL